MLVQAWTLLLLESRIIQAHRGVADNLLYILTCYPDQQCTRTAPVPACVSSLAEAKTVPVTKPVQAGEQKQNFQ
eukprot:1157436-Pelagomonas_calceolata.AAC.5